MRSLTGCPARSHRLGCSSIDVGVQTGKRSGAAPPAGAKFRLRAALVVRNVRHEFVPLGATEAGADEAADAFLQLAVVVPEDSLPESDRPVHPGGGERAPVRAEDDAHDVVLGIGPKGLTYLSL